MGEYVLAGISNDKANTKTLGKIEGLKSLSFNVQEKTINDCTSSCEYSYAQHK